MTKLAVISLWRPWADWVALGWKQYETRTHQRFARLDGQRIGIHAAQRWDKDALAVAEKYLKPWQIADTLMMEKKPHPLGGYTLCTAAVLEHRRLTAADSKYALIDCGNTERYGLLLGAIDRCSPLIHVTGRQGIFYVDDPTPDPLPHIGQ